MEMAKSKTQMEKVVSLHIFALLAIPIIKIQLLSGQLEQIFLQLDFSFGLCQLSQIYFYVEILKYPGKYYAHFELNLKWARPRFPPPVDCQISADRSSDLVRQPSDCGIFLDFWHCVPGSLIIFADITLLLLQAVLMIEPACNMVFQPPSLMHVWPLEVLYIRS